MPFPYATEDHQTMNARACVEAGAAFLVADADVEGAQFTDYLKTLVQDANGPSTHVGCSGRGEDARCGGAAR